MNFSKISLSVFLVFAGVSVARADNASLILALSGVSSDSIRSTLLSADLDGLESSRYWGSNLENLFRMNPDSPELDRASRQAYLDYLKDLSTGTVNPSSLGDGFTMKKKNFVSSSNLTAQVILNGYDASLLAEAFKPKSQPYKSLNEALKRITAVCKSNTWGNIPALDKDLHPGSVDSVRIPAIRNRLSLLGYPVSPYSNSYSDDMGAAIKDIQSVLLMKPDGIISRKGRTIDYLQASCAQRISEIKLDMEKLRWFPSDFGDRYVYVNIAHNYLVIKESANSSLDSMRVIVGRAQRKTPTIIDRIPHVTINPQWVIPPTIFREDKVTVLRNLKGQQIEDYFKRNNYEVWNREFTKKIPASSINWATVSNSTPIYIKQLPGRHNALGVVKFDLTNGDAIYLHDTNNKAGFHDFDRQVSSGCVRVADPFGMAAKVLKGTSWTREKIEATAAKAGELPAKSTYAKLNTAYPVYMVFQAATLSSDGVIRFARDTYEQGKAIKAVRGY